MRRLLLSGCLCALAVLLRRCMHPARAGLVGDHCLLRCYPLMRVRSSTVAPSAR